MIIKVIVHQFASTLIHGPSGHQYLNQSASQSHSQSTVQMFVSKCFNKSGDNLTGHSVLNRAS